MALKQTVGRCVRSDEGSFFFSDIFRSNNIVKNFGEIITNMFKPLFEVSIDPRSHPELHLFLAHVRKLEISNFWATLLWAFLGQVIIHDERQ